MQDHVSTQEARRCPLGTDGAGQKVSTGGVDLFQIGVGDRSRVFREDLIRGQRLTPAEGLCRVAIRREEAGGETASAGKEKGPGQRPGRRNQAARQALRTLASCAPSAEPRPRRMPSIRQQGSEITTITFSPVLLWQHFHQVQKAGQDFEKPADGEFSGLDPCS